MTRQEILNSNLPPQEKQKRLNMLEQISAGTANASLGGLLQSSMQNMGNNPLGITPRPMLPQTPTPPPNVNIATPRQNISQQQAIADSLKNPVSTNILQQGMQPPSIAQQIQPPRTANKGIFNRLERAYKDAAPMLAMAQEFNRMGAARPMGSNVQADPMGAYRKAKYGDEKDTRTSYEKVAKAMGIPLEEYMDKYVKQVNPLQQEAKLTAYKTMTEKANAAREALPNIDIMQSMLDDPNFDTGALSGIRKYALGLFDAFGLVDEEGRKQLSQLTSFDALSNNLVLPLVKMLGVNPTDRDLAFVQAAAPTLGKSKESNQLLINALKIAQRRQIRYQALYVEVSSQFGGSKTHPELEMIATNKLTQEFAGEVENLKEQFKGLSNTEQKRFVSDD